MNSQPASQPTSQLVNTTERKLFLYASKSRKIKAASRLHYVLDGAIEKLYFFLHPFVNAMAFFVLIEILFVSCSLTFTRLWAARHIKMHRVECNAHTQVVAVFLSLFRSLFSQFTTLACLFSVCIYCKLPLFWHHSRFVFKWRATFFAHVANSKLEYLLQWLSTEYLLTDLNFLWLIYAIVSILLNGFVWTTMNYHVNCKMTCFGMFTSYLNVLKPNCLLVFTWMRSNYKAIHCTWSFTNVITIFLLFFCVNKMNQYFPLNETDAQVACWCGCFLNWRVRSPSPTCTFKILTIPIF